MLFSRCCFTANHRLRMYANFTDEIFVSALLYIDRFHVMNGIKISYFNVHQLLTTSLLIAYKFNHGTNDMSNKDYTLIIGIPLPS